MNMPYCQLEQVSRKVCVESDFKLTSCSYCDESNHVVTKTAKTSIFQSSKMPFRAILRTSEAVQGSLQSYIQVHITFKGKIFQAVYRLCPQGLREASDLSETICSHHGELIFQNVPCLPNAYCLIEISDFSQAIQANSYAIYPTYNYYFQV